MTTTEELISLLREQIEQQRKENQEMMKLLLGKSGGKETTIMATAAAIPSFPAFDPSTELWSDYWSRFQTFIGANSIPDSKIAQVFLTNQSKVVYKQLSDLASQQTPKQDVNNLNMEHRRFHERTIQSKEVHCSRTLQILEQHDKETR